MSDSKHRNERDCGLRTQRGEQFTGFPSRTLLEVGVLPAAKLAELALKEGQGKHPLFKVHRWFARRLSSQFRAIIAGLLLGEDQLKDFWKAFEDPTSMEGAVVLDPFVGGGTSLVEASRVGARVVGVDIDPVASFITRFEFEAGMTTEPVEVAMHHCSVVRKDLAAYHSTKVGRKTVRVLHHFWVERRTCLDCRDVTLLHPHYRLAIDTSANLQWAICRGCGKVHELDLARKIIQCSCGCRTTIANGPLKGSRYQCAGCCKLVPMTLQHSLPARRRYDLFAQEYLEERHGLPPVRKFKRATQVDYRLYLKASKALTEVLGKDSTCIPSREIPKIGRSDQRPLIHGFSQYSQLFNSRQLLHLAQLGKVISQIQPLALKNALAIAFSEHLSTNCMYTAYAFGYRRLSPLFSIHSYRHITRPVEINPWLDGIGRGTYPNALRKVYRAIDFVKKERSHIQVLTNTMNQAAEAVVSGSSDAAILTANSENLSMIADSSVDLVLTDPPYFDNLSYSELSDFYLAWHQVLGIAQDGYGAPTHSAPITQNLALRGRSEEGVALYTERLGRVFAECHRVLRDKSPMVFTYHHTSWKAWLALGRAICRSGFVCSGSLPLRGEGQGGLHSYAGTIKWDAVLILRKTNSVNHSNDAEPVVSCEDIERAGQETKSLLSQLSKKASIGFRTQDALNILRAKLVGSATIKAFSKKSITLESALSSQTIGV